MGFKKIIKILDFVFFTYWGFTLIDLIAIVTVGKIDLLQIDNFIKVLFSIIGVVYMVLRLQHTYLDNKLNREIKKQDLIKKKKENEGTITTTNEH